MEIFPSLKFKVSKVVPMNLEIKTAPMVYEIYTTARGQVLLPGKPRLALFSPRHGSKM